MDQGTILPPAPDGEDNDFKLWDLGLSLQVEQINVEELRATLNAEILDHAVTARRLRDLEARALEDVSTGDLLFALAQRVVRKVMRWPERA